MKGEPVLPDSPQSRACIENGFVPFFLVVELSSTVGWLSSSSSTFPIQYGRPTYIDAVLSFTTVENISDFTELQWNSRNWEVQFRPQPIRRARSETSTANRMGRSESYTKAVKGGSGTS